MVAKCIYTKFQTIAFIDTIFLHIQSPISLIVQEPCRDKETVHTARWDKGSDPLSHSRFTY
uniref:Uncharacterized protein n=1 Tax=Virgibacillus oceani TaxID=1479511 RepID=A0A917M8M6_9BACI|nr:hypothetical protein GCM10011398_32800 [Virgibacillus oceani]